MTCLHPISVGHGSMACGHCMACRITYTREWSVRLMHELSSHEEAVFVTLTYDDNHLPYMNSIYRHELQNFLKRLRKGIAPKKIKYFACGEYGETSKRPHYHLIIFGMKGEKRNDPVISKAWGKGYVYCGGVTWDSVQYVCGYILKKFNGEKQKEEYGDRWPNFMACSKGLGLAWIEKHASQVCENLTVTHRGEPIGIPRYYRAKLGDQLDLKAMEAARKERSDKRLEKMIDIVGDRLSITTALIDGRSQSEEALKTKQSMRRRKL